MRIIHGASLAALLASVAAPAAAQDIRGAYVSLRAGVANVGDVDVNYFDMGGTFGGTGATDRAETSADLKRAFTFGGAVGYDFGALRTDLEIDYTRNKVESLTLESINGSAVTLTPADIADICDYLEAETCSGSGNSISVDGSRARQLSAMANAWFDIPIGEAVAPYVGAGLGAVGYEFDGEGKVRFAWQIGAGVAFNVSRATALTLDFRHRRAKGTTIEYDDFAGAGVEIGRVKTNSILAGVRFRF